LNSRQFWLASASMVASIAASVACLWQQLLWRLWSCIDIGDCGFALVAVTVALF
jgi:hypothetical protein